jgi:uncharacterized protein
MAHLQRQAHDSADRVAVSAMIVGTIAFGLLVTESAVLSAPGIQDFAVCLFAILAASTVSSIAGFAFSALSGAFLFHFMESPVSAVQVMVVCSIAIQLLSVATLWRIIDWRNLPVFLAGGVLGVPAGVYLLLNLHTSAYRDVIGGFLIFYGAYLLLRNRARPLRATGPVSDAIAGVLSGLTGGLAGFPGAFVTIWCSLKGWDKARQRGLYQPFILAMQPVTLVCIYIMQPRASTPAQLDWKTFAFVPAALLGAWLGLRVFKRLSDRQFDFAVCALLISSGIALIL